MRPAPPRVQPGEHNGGPARRQMASYHPTQDGWRLAAEPIVPLPVKQTALRIRWVAPPVIGFGGREA